ncbi:MAG: ferritin-like domain-containing protein [Polyangiaceae bacterium]
MLVGGKDTGFDQCAGGRIRRRSAMACPSLLPRASGGTCGAGIDSGISGGCRRTPTAQRGRTDTVDPAGSWLARATTGVSDQDCGADQICLCGEQVGRCVSATCKDAASCSGGAQCADFDRSSGCGVTTFACTTPADKCFSDSDCSDGGGGMCLIESNATSRTCSRSACAIGRPFVVAGTARVAPHARRSDWLGDERPNLGGLDAATRASLAARWREVAALEHGSIASFARFTLELLALGAPSDLVLDTQRAAADEVRHARTAYAFATAYGDGSVGLAPLAIDGAIESPSWERFVERLVREGCVGKTFGALEAAEAAARADDPVVRDALLLVAMEEAEHAALAWRALRLRSPTAARASRRSPTRHATRP